MPGVGPKTAARWAELGLADVWQIQQMEEPALERLIGPRRAGAQAPGPRLRRHDAARRAAAPLGEPGDHPLARPARPRGAGGDPLAAHRAGGGPAPGRASGRPHGHAQAAARRLPHRDPAAHARGGAPISTPSSTRPRGSCSGRRSTTCARRNRGVRLIGIAATNLGVAAEADLFESAGAAAAARSLGRGGSRCGRSSGSAR